MKSIYKLLFLLTAFFISDTTHAQKKEIEDTIPNFKTISAGPQYKRSSWHRFLWGSNYRKEWSTRVKLPVLLLDSAKGGLIATEQGGGHQTTSLHLETKEGKEYTLRSVDKRLGKVLPENFRGTFIEGIANDEVSMSHPYGAVTVPVMANAAGIYHTNPQYVYLPRQEALDSFNDKLGNNVYLFEQRIKGDWENADNLGNFDKFYGTDEVMKKLQDETENRVDQAAFLKARLFDMIIGDWDRHEEQWEWGVRKKGKKNIFVPVPQDRDQAYFKHSGVLLNTAIFYSGLNYFQSFKDHISNVKTLTYEERGLDRLFMNELTKSEWEDIAKQLQTSLTDNVIETAVKKLPPEIFAISGKKIISDLKSRRDHILEYAIEYYLFLAKGVEVVGTKGTDYFDVARLNNDETAVNVYNINKEGAKESKPYYSRTFITTETKEVRLFGIAGNDIYSLEGQVNDGIKIRIIGGYDKDSITINSPSPRKAKVVVYDGPDDYIHADSKIRTQISSDSDIHKYVYRSFVYDKRGFKPSLFYSDGDRIYVGLSYGWEHYTWKKSPYTFKQNLSAHYSITQRAFSFTYRGIFPNTIGKWDLGLLGNYDLERWTNFYGLGNESMLTTRNKDFNRMRTTEGYASVGLNKKTGNSYFEINGFFQSIKIINDESRYTAKNIAPIDSNVFQIKNFAGATAGYTFSKLDDPIVPVNGFTIAANVSYTQNVQQTSRSFWKYGGLVQLYFPLVSKFSLAVSGGIESVDGDPEFYQYPSIGGGQNLRGFLLQRFYGKTAFYNSNELRFISKVKSYLFGGTVGLLGFVDDGRVWMPGEESNTLHVGYGGGIIVAPFNLMFLEVTYGFSDEDKLLQLRLNMKL